ncbi:amidohydrolase 2 [Thozetella sp. PMI_491]|nr:amidohydrolase 2 [Thozetella sp. PMI_491]
MAPKGTIAIEEAVLNEEGIAWMAETATLYAPGSDPTKIGNHPHTQMLLDIHGSRLAKMDAEGVEYMLLSLTSPGCQGQRDPERAKTISINANNWMAAEVAKNPSRFGGLASLSMHNGAEAAEELRRAVKELGMFGAILNDYQIAGENEEIKLYFDEPQYDVFWKTVEELGVPVYMHPRYPVAPDLEPDTKYGQRRRLIGAGVQFHLDLSFHIYAICSSGFLDKYPGVQLVAGHLGEGIPFNLWRADHWFNKPVKKASRPCKEDYKYYFTHNVSITTSGDFSTQGLKFCIDEIGVDRCLFSIDYPYDTIEQAQAWWREVDLPEKDKEAVARGNAIRLFKLPLEP